MAAIEKPLAKKAMPCAAPVRFSGIGFDDQLLHADQHQRGRKRVQRLNGEEARNTKPRWPDERIDHPAYHGPNARHRQNGGRRTVRERPVEQGEHDRLGADRPGPKHTDQRVAQADRLPVDRDEAKEKGVARIDDAGASHEQNEIAVEDLRARPPGSRPRKAARLCVACRVVAQTARRASVTHRLTVMMSGTNSASRPRQDDAADQIAEQEGDRAPYAHACVVRAKAANAGQRQANWSAANVASRRSPAPVRQPGR